MDYDIHVDPELRSLLANAPRRDGLEVEDLEGVRSAMRASWSEPSGRVHTQSFRCLREDGNGELRLLVNRPLGEPLAETPCILWVHGGGYMLGAPEMDQRIIEEWVLRHKCLVVAPDYRLAPETPYPGAFDDCRRALDWALGASDDVRVAADRVVVGGISAGAGLAAAVTLYEAQNDGHRLSGQILLFPMLDDRFRDHASSRLNVTGWGSMANYLGWKSYLAGEPGGKGVPASAAVARAQSVRGLPHTFLVAGDMDILRDDALVYMNRLVEEDVAVDFRLYHGGTHGFISQAPTAALSKGLEADIDTFLRRCFEYGSRVCW